MVATAIIRPFQFGTACVLLTVGHGHSEGERVHVKDVDTYVDDVINHVDLMKIKYPHLPYILMGHSMVSILAHLITYTHVTHPIHETHIELCECLWNQGECRYWY